MSRQGICNRCHRGAWLDRCRECAGWFCDLCFSMSTTFLASTKAVAHEKLRPEDVTQLDAIENLHAHQYKTF